MVFSVFLSSISLLLVIEGDEGVGCMRLIDGPSFEQSCLIIAKVSLTMDESFGLGRGSTDIGVLQALQSDIPKRSKSLSM